MATRTFNIEWQGGKSEVEYDDDISFGSMETIIKACVDLSDVTKPKVNLSEYRSRILNAVLTKAPFNHGDPQTIKRLPRKTVENIIKEVMTDYPLAVCLEGWMTSFLGSTIQKSLKLKSTDSVPTTSDGPKKPQTNNQQNGSKEQSQQAKNNSKAQSPD